jgi:hypothetical protein
MTEPDPHGQWLVERLQERRAAKASPLERALAATQPEAEPKRQSGIPLSPVDEPESSSGAPELLTADSRELK